MQISPQTTPKHWILFESVQYPGGRVIHTVYPKKYPHGFCFAVLCCGYTLTDFPISIRLTSLALWQSNDCPNATKATLMNMDKYFMWIHYERLHNHNKAKHNKTVCIFLGIYCISRGFCCIWFKLRWYIAMLKLTIFVIGYELYENQKQIKIKFIAVSTWAKHILYVEDSVH